MATCSLWLPPKLLLTMKITMLILFAALIQVSAASYSQKITLTERDAPLERIIESIKRQSGYMFFYNKEDLKESRSVSIELKNVTIEDALESCLAGQAFSFKIFDHTIVIKKKEPELMEKVSSFFRQDSLVFKGRVLDALGAPLSGASIKIKGGKKITYTTSEGNFAIFAPADATLQVSYLGYELQELKLRREDAAILIMFNMKPEVKKLEQVEIVSTGYQEIPKERATGSFEVISNKQLNQVTGTNILKRLEGNTTALNFNNQLYPTSSSSPVKHGVLENLTIRGQNTLFGNSTSGARVLVVVDGIPVADDPGTKFNSASGIMHYAEDQVGKINPNDVENITILKDAAATSVWGSRAANGVIVITTKKGKFNQPVQVSVATNLTVADKPDLFYLDRTSTASFIELQKMLFSKGLYNGSLITPSGTSMPPAIPMAAEILDQQRRNVITEDQANVQLNALAKNDVRNDLTKYVLRNAVNNSHNLALSGGTREMAYRLSLGYDKNLNNTVKSGSDRININSTVSYKPTQNLTIDGGLIYKVNNLADQSINTVLSEAAINYLMPYDKLADDQGRPLVVPRLYQDGYRQGYIDTVGRGKLLDWHYRPLEDLNNGTTKSKAEDVNLNLNVNYKINEMLSANITYGYQSSVTNAATFNSVNSYYTRNMINMYTSSPYYKNDLGEPHPYERSIPVGGTYSPTVNNLKSNDIRGQLNLNKTWNKHNIIAIAGLNLNDTYNTTRYDQYYGYDENLMSYYANLNFQDKKPMFYGGKSIIPSIGSSSFSNAYIDDNRIRTTKGYLNAAYTYDRRYTLSGSIAKDASNVFGVDANKSFKPYYSAGLSWNIVNESFYKVAWLPRLQLRATYGYQGMINYTYSPYPYIEISGVDGLYNKQFALLRGATNPLLRPEKTGQLNVGLDFGFVNGRITGSFEMYDKRNKDLIAGDLTDPTTGFNSVQYNVANVHGQGIDFSLNTLNIKTGKFSWTSTVRASTNKVIVTDVYVDPVRGLYSSLLAGNLLKVEGKDINSIYALKWAGLDPTNGAPQIEVDGKPSSNYFGFMFKPFSTSNSVKYMGTTTPRFFGSFRNTLSYGEFSISANVIYRLKYYVRKSPNRILNYNLISTGTSLPPAEYDQRWQKPGDEATTNVPSFVYPPNTFRDIAYQYADINVIKGDNVRLQELNFSYGFKKPVAFLKNLSFQGSISNLGILWKANKAGIDPDIQDVKLPKTYAIGFNASF